MSLRNGSRPSERRTSRRFARRAQVRYWRRGEEHERTAFVHDISTTGLFIATPHPLARGTEIRVEISDQGLGYSFEAIVTRRVWIAPDLRKLGPSGMGARFIAPEELVARLRARGAGRVGVTRYSDDHFLVILEDDRRLLRAYARDLDVGRLFIPTATPAALNRGILVDFQLPDSDEVCTLAARVVHRLSADQTGDSLRAGMSVVFANAGTLLDKLQPYLVTPVSNDESRSSGGA